MWEGYVTAMRVIKHTIHDYVGHVYDETLNRSDYSAYILSLRKTFDSMESHIILCLIIWRNFIVSSQLAREDGPIKKQVMVTWCLNWDTGPNEAIPQCAIFSRWSKRCSWRHWLKQLICYYWSTCHNMANSTTVCSVYGETRPHSFCHFANFNTQGVPCGIFMHSTYTTCMLQPIWIDDILKLHESSRRALFLYYYCSRNVTK